MLLSMRFTVGLAAMLLFFPRIVLSTPRSNGFDAPETAAPNTPETPAGGAVGDGVIIRGPVIQRPTASNIPEGGMPAAAVNNPASRPGQAASVISRQTDTTSAREQQVERPQVPDTVAEANQMVEELLQSGRKDEAVALAREARKEWPTDPNLMSVDKIVGYRNGSMFDRAKELARQIMEGMTMSPGALAEQSDVYAGGGSRGDIAPTMAGVISMPGGSSGRANTMADARAVLSAMAIHDYQKMEQKASAALANNPKDFRSYRARAFARSKLGRLQDAEADARRAVAIEPKDLMSRTALVDILVDLKRPKEATAEAQRGLDARRGMPKDKAEAHLYHARSRAWALLGEKDLAAEDMTQAAGLQPELYSAASLLNGAAAEDSPLLPESPWAQAAVGGLAAAALLLPLTWWLGWWRRDERA